MGRAGDLLPRVPRARQLARVPHALETCAIGMRRPLPKAFVETFSPGAACCRLYSARSICRAIPATSASGAPPRARPRRGAGCAPRDPRGPGRGFVGRERVLVGLVRASSADGAFSSVRAGIRSVRRAVQVPRERVDAHLREVGDRRRGRRTCRRRACSSRRRARSCCPSSGASAPELVREGHQEQRRGCGPGGSPRSVARGGRRRGARASPRGARRAARSGDLEPDAERPASARASSTEPSDEKRDGRRGPATFVRAEGVDGERRRRVPSRCRPRAR